MGLIHSGYRVLSIYGELNEADGGGEQIMFYKGYWFSRLALRGPVNGQPMCRSRCLSPHFHLLILFMRPSATDFQ